MKKLIQCFFLLYIMGANGQLPPCFSQVEQNFFNYDVVAQAFSNNGIPQSAWPVLYAQIQQNVRYVPVMVEQTAARMSPNPLNPYQPLLAGELLKRVLYKIFFDTMFANRNIVTDRQIHESDIRQMFLYIRSRQTLLLSSCFGAESEADQRVTE